MKSLKLLYEVHNLIYDLKESPKNFDHLSKLKGLLFDLIIEVNDEDGFVASSCFDIFKLASKNAYDRKIDSELIGIFNIIMYAR